MHALSTSTKYSYLACTRPITTIHVRRARTDESSQSHGHPPPTPRVEYISGPSYSIARGRGHTRADRPAGHDATMHSHSTRTHTRAHTRACETAFHRCICRCMHGGNRSHSGICVVVDGCACKKARPPRRQTHDLVGPVTGRAAVRTAHSEAPRHSTVLRRLRSDSTSRTARQA